MLLQGHPAWPSRSFVTALLIAASLYAGLDARAAAIVMRTVRNIVNTGRTIVCTIHQPSIDIFEAFDELLLLKRGGECIFNGQLGKDSGRLIDYFSVCCMTFTRVCFWLYRLRSLPAHIHAPLQVRSVSSSVAAVMSIRFASRMSVIAALIATPLENVMCTEASGFLSASTQADCHYITVLVCQCVTLVVSVVLCQADNYCL